MVFPFSKLPVTVELQLGGTWTDISPYCIPRDNSGGITITRGRQDESQAIDAGSCTLELDNRDLRFSPRYPLGPYYGLLGRNTPIRLSVDAGTQFLRFPDPAGSTLVSTPDNAAIDITGDIDVRFEASLTNWLTDSTSFHTTQCIGKGDFTGNQRSWWFGVRDQRLYIEWSNDGTTVLSAKSTAQPIPDADDRIAIRFTLDVNNGAAGNTTTFYTSSSINGPWVQLGTPIVQAGTTSLFNSSAALKIGNASGASLTDPVGRIFKAEVRNGIGGTVVANPDFTIQTLGQGSFADGAGRTWSFAGTGSITNRNIRFYGEVPAWPLESDASGNDVSVTLQAAGILRRLNQGSEPLQSTLRRGIPHYGPLAYWPMEGGNQTTQANSPIAGVGPLTLTNANWGSVDTLPSSDALPAISTAGANPCRMRGVIPGGGNGSWNVRFVMRLDTAPPSTHNVMGITSTGTVGTWLIQLTTTGVNVRKLDQDGALISDNIVAPVAGLYGGWVNIEFEAVQNGGNINWHIGFTFPDSTFNLAADFSFAGTVGRPTSVISPDGGFHPDLDGMALGHISAWPGTIGSTNAAYGGAMRAYAGETAGARLARLTTEQSIVYRSNDDPTITELVGTQGLQTITNLLKEAEDAELGLLYEDRQAVGLQFRSRLSRYNQLPGLVLNYPSRGHIMPPFKPVDDDQQTKNKVTVERANGSSATNEQLTGTLSTQSPPSGVGTYEDAVTLSLFTDDQTVDQAGWRVHLGTVDEPRYPSLNVWAQSLLAGGAANSVIDSLMALDAGDRVQVTNPAPKINNNTVDLQILGYTEFISQFRWEFEFVCVPASPWDVSWVHPGTTTTQRKEWSNVSADVSAQIGVAQNTTDTTLTLRNIETEVWTDDPMDSPYDLTISGEVQTVINPGGMCNSNPFFDANTTGWSVLNGAVARSTAFVHPHPRALASAKITPNGGTATAEAKGAVTAGGTVNVGGRYTVSAWIYSPAGWTDFQPSIDWYTSGGAYISTSVGTGQIVTAGLWTYISATATAPATADKAAVNIIQRNTPAATDVWYLWAGRITRIFSAYVYDEFGRTNTDTWTNADSGQAWTNVGTAADYDVLTGFGRHTNPAASAAHHSVIASAHANSETYLDIAVAALSTGASQFAGALARYTDVDNLYEARVEFTTANAINLTIRKRVATVETQLGTFSLVKAANVAGQYVRIRFRAVGTSLKAKIWLVGEIEPDIWHVDVTDSAITVAGSGGMKSVRNAGNTNANAITQFDNYKLRSPQTFTVVRSQNGVAKAQTVNTLVKLTPPAIVAL